MTFTSECIDFSGKSDAQVQSILAANNLALKVDEAKKVQFEILQRPPSLSELVLWSIQGSEHCSYKSSRPFLKLFPTEGPGVILGPKEDAGIIELARDEAGLRYGIALSHESHNHPSQIVPYEGAATGVGGNVRDVCCMGAKVIAIGDGLRFGELDKPKAQWIADGVVAGIAGYGNPLGIPNVVGDVFFDRGYNDNCLVTVLTLGMLREDEIIHSSVPLGGVNHKLILVGKPTDNSGFGGASFASLELEEDKKEQNKGAVQEPNAFLERHILKATYALVRWLKEQGHIERVGFKDLGAGGIACASVELADSAGYGAEVDLDQVHVSMDDLPDAVKLCSETQERFMWAVPDDLVEIVLDHYNKTFDFPEVSHGARASVIGNIRADGLYRVTAKGQIIVEARAKDVTEGLIYNRPHHYSQPVREQLEYPEPKDYRDALEAVITHPDCASKHSIYRRYDKQVQGLVVIERGQADAGVLRPYYSDEFPASIRDVGLAVSMAQNPHFGRIDAYWGAAMAVVEAVAKVAAVGAYPLAITDCLCYGNPEKPGQMGEFVEGIRGIADACREIRLKHYPDHPIPVVAGNVSLYNETRDGSIPPSPMIGCVGRLDDVERASTPGFKSLRSILYRIGHPGAAMGGSVYQEVCRIDQGKMPAVGFAEFAKTVAEMVDLIQAGWVLSSKSIGSGGMAMALMLMAFQGNCSCRVRVDSSQRKDFLLFSEQPGFILEVAPEHAHVVEERLSNARVPIVRLGETVEKASGEIQGIRIGDLEHLRSLWQNALVRS
jgi:phosphoribosylformylglycinamidine synthase subunit PurL